MNMSSDVDIANIEFAMLTLQKLIPSALDQAPMEVQEKFNNALLNIAVNRIIEVEGRPDTVKILLRLVNALVNDCVPIPGHPIALSEQTEM